MQKLIFQWVDSKGNNVSVPGDKYLWHITYKGVTSITLSSYKTVLSDIKEGTYSPNQVRHIAKGINSYAHRYNLRHDAFKTETVLRDCDIKQLREVFEHHADMEHYLVAKSVERYID
jgi:hypothetical protein